LTNSNFLNFNFINNTQLTNCSNFINTVYNNNEDFNYQLNGVNNLFQKLNLNEKSDETQMEIDNEFSNKNKYKPEYNNPISIKRFQNAYDSYNLHSNLNKNLYNNYYDKNDHYYAKNNNFKFDQSKNIFINKNISKNEQKIKNYNNINQTLFNNKLSKNNPEQNQTLVNNC